MSAASGTRPSWRWQAGWSIAFLAALALLAWRLELGVTRTTILDARLDLPAPSIDVPADVPAAPDPLPSVTVTPAFDLSGPTTLALSLERTAEPGFVGVDVALVSETTQAVRELTLGTLRTPSPDGVGTRGDDRVRAVIDRIPTGRYILRLAPRFEGPDDVTPRPTARLVAVSGERSSVGLAVALGLLAIPPLATAIRGLWRRSDAASTADVDPTDVPTPAIDETSRA